MTKILNDYGPLINGSFVIRESDEVITDINPATQEILTKITCANSDDVDMAVANAEKAYQTWKTTSRGERAKLLNQIADTLEREKEYFARVETLDTGKCFHESLLQIGLCVEQYRYFASSINAHEDICVRHDDGSFSMIVKEPLGIVALILPFNAPSMLMSWKLAPALAAGNCVVIKPSSNAPLPILEIARMCQNILPPGVLNVVPCKNKAGNHLVNHPKIAKTSFTGSTEVGREIGETSGRNIVPSTLELGGKSANIIFPDASLDKALQFTTIGILSSAGQVCVAGSRLFLHEDVYDSFLEKLKIKFEAVRVGNPLQPDVQMGPQIHEKQMNTILNYIDIGKQEGARLVCGGKQLTGGEYDKGFFVAPTIFADVNNNMRIAREEIFGPVLVVIKFKTEEEVIKMANDSDYGLGAGVWTKDINRAIRVSSSLEAGTVWVNDYLNSTHGGPFGGYKKSGIGREVHKVALDYYSQIKNICVSPNEEYPPAF